MLRVTYISIFFFFLLILAIPVYSLTINYNGSYAVHYIYTTYFNASGFASIKVDGENISVDEAFVICNKSLENVASEINRNISELFNQHVYNSYYYTFTSNGSNLYLRFYFTNSSELLIPYYLPISIKNGTYNLILINENVTSGKIVQYNTTANVKCMGDIINITFTALCNNPFHYYFINGYYAYNKTNGILQYYENIFSGRVNITHGPLDFVDTLHLSRSFKVTSTTSIVNYIEIGGIIIAILLVSVLIIKKKVL